MLCRKAIFIQNPWENKLLELVDNINEELFIINPFIKKDIIEKILASLKNKKLKILLKTNVFDMANNVFDLETLYLLKAHNAEIRTIRNLHAKLFIFDNKKAIVTSSNLTKAGLNSNIEFSILIEDDEFVKGKILPIVDEYWSIGEKITITEFDKIKLDLEKVNDIKDKLSPFEIKAQQISTFGNFVSPMGEDILRNTIDLSQSKRYEIITDRLMREKNLDESEILSLISKYFKKEYIKKNILKICAGGLDYCFNSEYPFTTAGIYYKNILKIYPDFNLFFSNQTDNSFKNMIMERGKTNVKIKTHEDYYRLQNEFFENFDMKPPKSVNILKAILFDEHCINKMSENLKYYFRVKNIFGTHRLEELKPVILEKLEEKSKSIKNKKQSEVEEERIKILDLAIHRIEEKIKDINQN